jgi:hypothetical protein
VLARGSHWVAGMKTPSPNRTHHRLGRVVLGAALGLAACSSGPEAPTIQRSVALVAFDDCAALEQHIEDVAVQDMRNRLDPDRVGVGRDVALAGGVPQNAETGGGAPSAYSRTNTQVAGVDEADFVKSDGTHLYVLSGRSLYIARSWPADALALLSRTEVEGYPREMFLEEDSSRVTVLSVVAAGYEDPNGIRFPWYCAEWGCGVEDVVTKVTVIDASDRAAPRVLAERWVPGRYQTSRRVGSAVRLVLDGGLHWPENLEWWPSETGFWDDALGNDRAFRRLMDANEVKIRAQSLDDWLPPVRHRAADGRLVALSHRCTDFSRPNAPVSLGLTTVATVDLDDPTGDLARSSLIAHTDEVYANAETLVLAQHHWWWWPTPGQRDWTYLFAFDLSDPRRATLRAAAGLDGHLLDQFAMDEHAGHLRVATTVTIHDEDLDEWWRTTTTNRVTVLDRALQEVGRTEDLAPGERIFAARFIGDRGFVVTFRQVDPLFTLDLSVPSAPRVVGELKVPGFSTYLHPLDRDHLLAIGVHVPDPAVGGNPWGGERTLKLTMFDVSDLAHPREKFTQLVGTAYGWSEAQYEHKAFTFLPERGLLAIPFSDWVPQGSDPWGGLISQVRVFSIDTTTGITPRGAVDLFDVYRQAGDPDWSWYWSPWVRRASIADDYVYAIANAGIRVAHVDDLSTPVGTVRFDRAPNTP